MILSIIIPMYNVEQYIRKCILSCMNQNIPASEYEIIIINDGSPDNSLSIATELCKTLSNVTIFSQENKGLSSARNIGMQMAKGDYIMFVDSDDWIKDNCLGLITDKLHKERPDILALSAAWSSNGTVKDKVKHVDTSMKSGKDALVISQSPCAQFSIWNSHFLKKHRLKFFEGIYHEDSEFTPRAYYLAEKVSFLSETTYYVFANPNSITRSVNPKKAFDLVEVVCKNLAAFSMNVDEEYKWYFYNTVAMYLNNAMHTILQSDAKKQEELNQTIFNNRYLYNYLSNSLLLKYRIEAVLMRAFPKHPLSVYRFMQVFNK